MLIRRIEVSELEALLSLYAHLHRQDTARPPLAAVRAVWLELMTSSRHAYWGAYANDELVASCALAIIPNLTRSCRPYGIIENVVTQVEHRRRGYGRGVIDQALSYAWSVDCYKVMLLTGRRDESTLRFYESVGFDRHAKQAFIAQPPA